MILHDYRTGEALRPATIEEWQRSYAAAADDGGRGVIEIDGRSVYVEGDPDPYDQARALVANWDSWDCFGDTLKEGIAEDLTAEGAVEWLSARAARGETAVTQHAGNVTEITCGAKGCQAVIGYRSIEGGAVRFRPSPACAPPPSETRCLRHPYRTSAWVPRGGWDPQEGFRPLDPGALAVRDIAATGGDYE